MAQKEREKNMAKKKLFLTLDTETATLPFANEIALNAKQKQAIAIAKPLVYDIGWTVSDRQGNILHTEEFLVQETFFVPNVFNTAYYKDKRPQYMERFENGEIKAKSWNEIIQILLSDLRTVDYCTAYNAAFDFKKAIPFTEKYIKALYSNWYQKWEERQYNSCVSIVQGSNSGRNDKYLTPIFELRNEEFPIIDLWEVACDRIINNQRYKDFCLDNDFLTATGLNFKTSAETTYRYMKKDKNFIESHTALDDALIETEILARALRKGKIDPVIGTFPFKHLGDTVEHVLTKKKKNEEHLTVLINQINRYLENARQSNYTVRLERILEELEFILDNEC